MYASTLFLTPFACLSVFLSFSLLFFALLSVEGARIESVQASSLFIVSHLKSTLSVFAVFCLACLTCALLVSCPCDQCFLLLL